MWGRRRPWAAMVLSAESCSRGSSCRGIAGSVPQSGRSLRLQGKTSVDCSLHVKMFPDSTHATLMTTTDNA